MRPRTSYALATTLALLLGIMSAPGCATTRTTETTVTDHQQDTSGAHHDVSDRVVTSETTTEVVEADTCTGVLSCTVDFVGDVIAFPFRLLGAVFKAVF